MIVTGLLNLFLSWVDGLISVFPTWTEPDWMTHLGDYATTVGQTMSSFGWILPFDAVYTVVNGLFGVLTVTLTIKVGMKILSLFTGGGGAG